MRTRWTWTLAILLSRCGGEVVDNPGDACRFRCEGSDCLRVRIDGEKQCRLACDGLECPETYECGGGQPLGEETTNYLVCRGEDELQ